MCAENRALHTRWRKGILKRYDASGAVIRNFEIIGEAAKRVPEAYRRGHSQIPWRLMAGFRDVLIHAYEGIDLQRVWQIVRQDLPVVKEAIEKLLPPLEELEKELAEPETDKEKSKK